jgi:copper ion binding protein
MEKRIYIEGMSCNHCSMRVEKVLKNIDGIKNVKVDLAGKVAIVESEKNISDKAIKEIIDEAGYKVVNIK